VLFYLCWEVMLLPLVLLIALWGGPLCKRAALKLLLFTLAGSLLMLLAFLALYLLHGQQTGNYTFALQALTSTVLPPSLAPWLLGALGLAFLVKIPVVPLHGWLPDAYAEAPTGASLLMAGALSKTGLYGLARVFLPLLPDGLGPVAPLLAALALLSILYGAALAYAQSDLKRLVGYASIAHLGFIVLGLAANNALALEGALLQLFNHGITTAALFVLVDMIERRTDTRHLDELGGLWAHAPQLGAFVLFFALAALGLPGLNIFVGEILILLGAFRANAWWGGLGMLGVLLAACYMLRLAQGVLWGRPRPDRALRDLSRGEAGLLAPLAALVLWGGIYPGSFLLLLHEPVRQLLAAMAGKGGLP
jgi:NADH-quinone oxidoreductase subunit M